MNIRRKTFQDDYINFNGLNKVLKKEIYSKKAIKEFSHSYSRSNGIVGNLPHEWINNMPQQQRENSIKELYSRLGACINGIRHHLFNRTDEHRIQIEKILKQCKAINENTSIQMNRIGEGAYGVVYKINKYILKIFYWESPYDSRFHGVHSECNTKIYLKHNLSKKDKANFSKFHFGDINNGYYLEEYIPTCDSLSPKPKETPEKLQRILTKLNLQHSDCNRDNYTFNDKGQIILFDFGGIKRLHEGA